MKPHSLLAIIALCTSSTFAASPSLTIYNQQFAVVRDTVNLEPGLPDNNAPNYGTQSNKKVSVYREFENSEANRLGIPLPKGRVRFYTQDNADQSLQFVGENELDHTPKDELVRLYIGDSFDLVGERSQTDYRQDGANRWAEETIEVKLRNRKKAPVEIRVVEHLYRSTNWEIRKKSQEFSKMDAQTIEFRVPLRTDEERVITYQVHYSW